MGKRIVAIIMIISLCVTTVVGALRLSLRFAKAEYDIQGFSIEQLVQYLDDNFSDEVYYSDVRNHLVNSVNIDSNTFYCLGILDDTCFSFSEYYFPYIQGEQWEHYAINGAWASFQGNHYYESQVYLIWNCNAGFGGSGLTFSSYNYQTSFNGFNLVLDETMNSLTYACAFPSTGSLNGDFKLYFSKDVYSNLGYEVAYSANLFQEAPAPEEVEFQVKSFWLGEKQYLTVTDQYLMYSMIDFNNEGQVLKSFRGLFYTDHDSVSLYLPFEDTVFIDNGDSFIDGLTNIQNDGVYAWDITNKGLLQLQEMFMYYHVDGSTGDVYAGYATNCPYSLTIDEPGSNGNPDSYTQLWTEWNTYVTNYNTTPVVPDQLASALFGSSGLWSYPVSVAAPNQSLTVWKWWTLEEDLGINFDLMDTVLVHSGASLYTLVFFYDHSLQRAFIPVNNFDIYQLFENFDCVIIVPDDHGELDQSSWWEGVLDYLNGQLGMVFDFTFQNNYAVSGSSSGGVEYVESRPSSVSVVLDGYCYVTKRGIQRQQLYNFSDGITKFYKLMSDYVESEDSWKSSFIQLSAAWFSAINTLNGSISGLVAAIQSINLSGIEDKLDQLIENTSEQESNFWFVSLWNWISQFNPSDNDFATSLQTYDDNWDNIPMLSPVPTIPVLPTIQVGGG